MTKTNDMRYGTLNDDFKYWWRLSKYQKQDIEARELFGHLEVIERIPDFRGKDWPGPETDVTYSVRLSDGTRVGFREPRTEKGRRKKYAEFPYVVAA